MVKRVEDGGVDGFELNVGWGEGMCERGMGKYGKMDEIGKECGRLVGVMNIFEMRGKNRIDKDCWRFLGMGEIV